MMQRLSYFVKWYMYITTNILAVCAISFTVSGQENIPAKTLWQILVSGFLTTFVTVFVNLGEGSLNHKLTGFLRYFAHYLSMCAVMVLCGSWFGWREFNFTGIALMMADVAIVYLFTFLTYYFIDLKQANEINKKLKEKYDEERNE